MARSEIYKHIKPNQSKAIFLAKRQLPELVHDAVNLEGINYTLPEVQTLLDGITVGGHRMQDQAITINQAKAWAFLFDSIANNSFSFSKTFICALHNIAASEEALTWGEFRNGGVTIAGTSYQPPSHDKLNGIMLNLETEYTDAKMDDLYTQAISLFLDMARTQFFYDVNKRMGRFMMNGILLSHGYPAINLPAKRQLEFNQLMLDFYTSNNKKPMVDFMVSCLNQKHIEIMGE
jgi:Fic family protein